MSKAKIQLKLKESENQINEKLSELRKCNFSKENTDWLTKEKENLFLKINKSHFFMKSPKIITKNLRKIMKNIGKS